MRLTTLVTLTVLLAACGGGSDTGAPPTDTIAGTTSTAVPSLDERTELFSYDQSAPLNLVEKKTKSQKGAEVVDVVFDAADRKVSAFLVRPKGKPKAAVLWAHWYGEEANPDRKMTIDQVVELRRGLDVLEEQAGDVPVGFVGHDYGAMFGALLVADKRPQTYVLMAPDATFSNWFLKYFVRGASKTDLDRAFAPLEPVNNVGDAAPASVFFQFAKSDRFVPGYVADKLTEAASEPKKAESYDAGHELDDAARKDRLAWLRDELGLS